MYTVDRFGQQQDIIDKVDNGIKETVYVRLQNGAELIGTPEHKVLTLNEHLEFIWKPLENIQKNDVVVRRIGDNLWAKTSFILPSMGPVHVDKKPGLRNRNITSKVTVPSVVTAEFGEFLGMLMSDGSLSINGMTLHNEDNVVVKRFIELVRILFNLKCSIKHDKRTKSMQIVSANSRSVRRWFDIIGIPQYHNDNKVPKCILESPKNVIESFIRGYTLDGYFNQKAQWVSICSTTSRIMAKDLCALLWNLGYDAYLSRKNGRKYYFSESNKGLGKDQYIVTLSKQSSLKFVNEIGFSEPRKNEISLSSLISDNDLISQKSNSVPAAVFQEFYENNKIVKNEQLRSVLKHKSDRISMMIVQKYFSEMEQVKPILDPNFRFTSVVDITHHKMMKTYDITVDHSHEYIANSMIVHNTLKYKPELVDYSHFKQMLQKYQSQIRCCSVMPQEDKSSYEYLPEQSISSEEYEKIVDLIKSANQLLTTEEVGREHIECAGGICPVDFNSETK